MQVAGVHITSDVNIYLYVCVSLLIPVYALCVCLCVISDQSTNENHVICDTLLPKHTAS